MSYREDINWKEAFKNYYLWNSNQLSLIPIKIPKLYFKYEDIAYADIYVVDNGFWFYVTLNDMEDKRIGHISFDGQIKLCSAQGGNYEHDIIVANDTMILFGGERGNALFKLEGNDLVRQPFDIINYDGAYIVNDNLLLYLDTGQLYNYTTDQYLKQPPSYPYIVKDRVVYQAENKIYLAHFPSFETITEIDSPEGEIIYINDNFVVISTNGCSYELKSSSDPRPVLVEVYRLVNGQFEAQYNLTEFRPIKIITLLYNGQLMIKYETGKYKYAYCIFNLDGSHFELPIDGDYDVIASKTEPYLLVKTYSDTDNTDLSLYKW